MTDESLDLEQKDFIKRRMKVHERIEKTSQVIEVIEAMSSLNANPLEEIRSILLESQAKRDFVVDVVKAYRKENPGKPITEFFNERYRDRALVLLKPVGAIQEAIRTPEVRKPEVVSELDVKKALEEERTQTGRT
ncbi:MAG: hypothetical protein FJY77_03520 [Candidatus Altiarchaeales archaeon]|nr:hypothetical protein [Candidatus Altiarchaeales archaeon]